MKLANLLVGIAALPLAAAADGFDYTFVEGGIVNTEVDAGIVDIDGDGIGINGSFSINEDLHILAGYSDIDYDFGVGGSLLNVGLGFNSGISQDLDFVADVSYVSAEIDSGIGRADEDGYSLGAGIRARTGDNVELEAGLHYVDLDSSDTVVSVSGRYYFSNSFALGAGLADDDGGLSWNIGVRAEFGRR